MWSAVWTKMKRPSDEEIAARKSHAAIHQSAVATFSETAGYLKHVNALVAQDWSRTLAETVAGFEFAAAQAGISHGEAVRLYGEYQVAIQEGNTELVASIEATYQSWVDSAAAAAAAYDRAASAAVSAYRASEDAATTAYDEIYKAAIEAGLGEEEATRKATAAAIAASDEILAKRGEEFARIAAFDAAMALGAEATQEQRAAAALAAATVARDSWEAAIGAVEASDAAATAAMQGNATATADAAIGEAGRMAEGVNEGLASIQRQVDIAIRHHTSYSSSGSSAPPDPGPDGNPGGVPRAGGGPVSAGRAYTIGERGPETFVPSTSGAILPNGLTAESIGAAVARALQRNPPVVSQSPMTDSVMRGWPRQQALRGYA